MNNEPPDQPIRPNNPFRTPSSFSFPCFLMNFPTTLDNREANNVWMTNRVSYDYDKAFKQWMAIYQYVSKHALIYILPSRGNFQDLPFVANLGCYLPHLNGENVILLAHFQSVPRIGEEEVGRKFFMEMGYRVFQPIDTWEGEADLKWVRENLYVAPYGMRTNLKSHHWMEEKLGMEVISIKINDPKLYHWDCSFMPLGQYKAMVATSTLSSQDLKALERIVEIIEIPPDYIYNGWTNGLLLGNQILHGVQDGDQVAFERFIEKIGFEPVCFPLEEYEKSGADLSCLFMHLNYRNRDRVDIYREVPRFIYTNGHAGTSDSLIIGNGK